MSLEARHGFVCARPVSNLLRATRGGETIVFGDYHFFSATAFSSWLPPFASCRGRRFRSIVIHPFGSHFVRISLPPLSGFDLVVSLNGCVIYPGFDPRDFLNDEEGSWRCLCSFFYRQLFLPWISSLFLFLPDEEVTKRLKVERGG